ncbi:MAG: hypothetical protein ACRD5B_09485 [Nitrososphaeraceae archaeon]|jgi:hypothetical protein
MPEVGRRGITMSKKGYKHTEEQKKHWHKAITEYYKTHDSALKGKPNQSLLEYYKTHDVWNS